MLLIIGLILSIGTLAVSISALKSLPMFLQKIIISHPLISFAFNFALSSLITSFIGAGMISGVGNLLGSILFAVYCSIYGKQLQHSK